MNIFTIEGRMNRLRFLGAYLGINLTAGLLFAIASYSGQRMLVLELLGILVAFLSLLPAAQRFHDINLSGWYALALLIPIITLIPLGFLLFSPGTKGSNKYGIDPLARDNPQHGETNRTVPSNVTGKNTANQRAILTNEESFIRDSEAAQSAKYYISNSENGASSQSENIVPENSPSPTVKATDSKYPDFSDIQEIVSLELDDQSQIEDNSLYAKAWEEVKTKAFSTGAYAMARLISGEDETKINVNYIKLRVGELHAVPVSNLDKSWLYSYDGNDYHGPVSGVEISMMLEDGVLDPSESYIKEDSDDDDYWRQPGNVFHGQHLETITIYDAYSSAWDELESKSLDDGIWSRAYLKSTGDEKLARRWYIRLRVNDLLA